MPVRVAINGFGRVGPRFMRAAYDRRADIEVVAVNHLDVAPTFAHPLVHDSVLGRFPAQVVAEEGGISVGRGPFPGAGGNRSQRISVDRTRG